MKNFYLTLISATLTLSALSQSGDAVIYSEFGEVFTVYLNNQKKNDAPANNVQIKDLTSEFYSIRVDFEDPSMIDVSNNHFAIQFGQTTNYMLKMTRKGKYALRFHSSTPLGTEADVDVAAPSRPAAVSEPARPAAVSEPARPADAVVKSDVQIEQSAMGVKTDVKVKETSNSTEHTTEEKVEMDVNMGAFGVNMDVKIEESYSHTESGHVEMDNDQHLTRPVEDADVVYYDGPCSMPMTGREFDGNLNSIKEKSFEDSKLTMAKQMTKSKCLTSAQIAAVMGAFGFEDTRLEYAKFAYDYCFDTDNYFQVNNAFEFELTIDELNEYLESK